MPGIAIHAIRIKIGRREERKASNLRVTLSLSNLVSKILFSLRESGLFWELSTSAILKIRRRGFAQAHNSPTTTAGIYQRKTEDTAEGSRRDRGRTGRGHIRAVIFWSHFSMLILVQIFLVSPLSPRNGRKYERRGGGGGCFKRLVYLITMN